MPKSSTSGEVVGGILSKINPRGASHHHGPYHWHQLQVIHRPPGPRRKARQDSLQLGQFPLPRVFENMVCGNMIQNFPVTISDLHNAHTIYVPNVGSLRGKTVCKKT